MAVEAAGDYIAVAADSLRLGPAPGQVSHQACKIAKLSNQLVFAASGVSAYADVHKTAHSDVWNAHQIAEQAYSALENKRPDHLIEKLAEIYGEQLSNKINDGLKRDHGGQLLSLFSSREGGAEAIFAGFDEQHHRVIVVVTVGVQVAGAHVVGHSVKYLTGDESWETEVIGDTTIARELSSRKTERSQGWHNAILLRSTGLPLKDRLPFEVERIGQLTAENDPLYVGGPIDVILVTRQRGVTWVYRKPACSVHRHGKPVSD